MRKSLSARGIYERSLTEEDVLIAIRQYLELNGARVFRVVERIPWGRRQSEPGIPDLFCWFKGIEARVAFIEVKKPGGKRSANQINWINQAVEDGVIAFFAESVEDVRREMLINGIQLRGE